MAGTSYAATASTPHISGSGFLTRDRFLRRRHLRRRREPTPTRGPGSDDLEPEPPGGHVRKWSTIRPLRRARCLEPGKEERTMPYDLVIKNGMVIDGSGLPRFPADIGVRHGRIATVGRIRGRAREVIDADGQVVTPGFVDGHTHMDAQIFWDPLGTCSCWHGVTTVVMGNCGFTLAPCAASERHLVVKNLERAEDIAAEAMEAGIEWKWTTFPEFLDCLEGLPKGINYTGYLGHCALRTHVMGERAFEQAATEDYLRAMERELRDAIRAGAMGFTTSRSPIHETPDGRPVASRLATWGEVRRLVGVMGEMNAGIFELAGEASAASSAISPASATITCACAISRSRPDGPSRGACSAAWRRPRCGAATWTCSTRPPPRAGGCSPRCTAAGSTSCCRSRASCRSTTSRRGSRSARCRWPSSESACATPRRAAGSSRAPTKRPTAGPSGPRRGRSPTSGSSS